MGRRGPQPTPEALDRLHGRPRHAAKHAEVRGAGSARDLSPPAYFDEEQIAAWSEALARAPVNLLTASDAATLEMFVVAQVESRRCLAELGKAGVKRTVEGSRGQPIAHPAASQLVRHQQTMLRCIDHLGYSPAARTGLGRAARVHALSPPTEGEAPSSIGDLEAYLAEGERLEALHRPKTN
jgi:P27 family predicted phage terminase small subunit